MSEKEKNWEKSLEEKAEEVNDLEGTLDGPERNQFLREIAEVYGSHVKSQIIGEVKQNGWKSIDWENLETYEESDGRGYQIKSQRRTTNRESY